MITCPYCDGSGYWIREHWGRRVRPRKRKCLNCDGSGYLTLEELAAIRAWADGTGPRPPLVKRQGAGRAEEEAEIKRGRG